MPAHAKYRMLSVGTRCMKGWPDDFILLKDVLEMIAIVTTIVIAIAGLMNLLSIMFSGWGVLGFVWG